MPPLPARPCNPSYAHRKSHHRYHSVELTLPLFSYSCALFCTAQSAILNPFNTFHTLCAEHPGWGSHPSSQDPLEPFAQPQTHGVTSHSSLAAISSTINTYKTDTKQTTLFTFRMSFYEKTGGREQLLLTTNAIKVLYPERQSGSEGPLRSPYEGFLS